MALSGHRLCAFKASIRVADKLVARVLHFLHNIPHGKNFIAHVPSDNSPTSH